jgi:hypothetical protein
LLLGAVGGHQDARAVFRVFANLREYSSHIVCSYFALTITSIFWVLLVLAVFCSGLAVHRSQYLALARRALESGL